MPMLREVTDLPTNQGRGRESYVARDIIDFARSDMAIAEISYEGKKWHNIYNAARMWVYNHPDLCRGVGVTRRGEHIYLVKEGK
jgi:hypothetical protein